MSDQTLLFGCFMLYVIGVGAVLLERYLNLSAEPAHMPGGGWRAVMVIAVCWPLLVVLAVIGLVLNIMHGDWP